MLLRFFKNYQTFILILIPMMGIALWFNTFMLSEVEIDGNYIMMPLSKLVFNLVGVNSFISGTLALILLILNALLLVRLNISFNFIRSRTYLPAVFYLFFLSFIVEIQRLTPALMASTFVILAIEKVLSTFKQEKLAIQIMDAALLISVASLFYFPSLFLLFFLWICLILLRPFKWREWVFTLLGLCVPYLIYASIMYINGKVLHIPVKDLFLLPYIMNWEENLGIVDLLFFIFISFLVIIASVQMMQLFGTMKVHSRRIFMCFLWLFLFTILIYLIIPSASIEILYINAISLSFLFSHYFINRKDGWLSELLFLIILGFIVTNKIIG